MTPGVARTSSLGRNIASTYATQIVTALGQLVLFPVVAGAVGTDAYGLYLLATSIVILAAQDLGMAGATSRYVAEAVARRDVAALRSVVATSSAFFAVLAVAGAGVVALAYVVLRPVVDIPPDLATTARGLAVLAALQVVAASATTLNRFVLTGGGRLDLANGTAVVAMVLRVVVTLVVLRFTDDILVVACADTVLMAVTVAVLWLVRRAAVPEARARLREASVARLRSMSRLTLDLLVVGLAGLVIMQSGTLLVSALLPIAAVTVFGAGFRIYRLCKDVTNALGTAVLPHATAAYVQGDGDGVRRLYVSASRRANVLAICIAGPLVCYAQAFLAWWLGPGWDESATVAVILIVSLLANNNHLVALPVLAAQGDVRSYARLHVLWALSSVGLGLVLTPRLGVVGTAVAIAAPVVLLEPVYTGIALRRLGLRWGVLARENLVRSFGTGVPAIALGAAVAHAWAPTGIVGIALGSVVWVVLYAGLYWWLGATPGDRELLTRAARRSARPRSATR
ncbi:oligosaccharide flippase family protein [Cellulomonas sp. URHB0016]